MKKFITLLFGLLLVVGLQAQNRPILGTYSTTLEGKDTDTITFNIMPELDYLTLQFVPSYGAVLTDSLDFSFILEMRCTYTGAWTRITAADTISGTSVAIASRDTDGHYFFAPFKYLQLRTILTGIPIDTTTVTVYTIQKQ